MAKRRLCALAVILAALGLYLFDNNTGTRLLLAAAIALPLLSALYLLLSHPRAEVTLELPPTLVRGEATTAVLTLRSASPLPPVGAECELELSNRMTGESVLTVLPIWFGLGKTAQVEPVFTIAHCGELECKVARLRCRDLFGLFCRTAPCGVSARAVVPPVLSMVTVIPDDTADLLTDSQHYSNQKPGSDPSETFRIREYAPGDPIRQIHWKLTEKVDKTLVRDFGLPAEARILLTLEPAPVSPDETDYALDRLFSIGQALQELECPCTVRRPAGSELEAVSLYNREDWALFRSLLLSSPLPPVRLKTEGLIL